MADRIPVGTRVIVSGTGFGSKPRKGIVRPPALEKGYWVQFDHAPALHRCPDKKVKRAAPEKASKPTAGRRPTKLTIRDDVLRGLGPFPQVRDEAFEVVNKMIDRATPWPRSQEELSAALDEKFRTTPLNTLHRDGDLLTQLSDDTVSKLPTQRWHSDDLAKPTAPRRSPAYLAHIRRMDCCNCGAPAPSDPHHEGKRGVGQKCSDLLTVPLCRRCHRIYTDENQLPHCNSHGKDIGRYSREDSLAILHGAQVQVLSTAIERLPLQKRAEILAAGLALVDEETMKETLR